MTDPPDSSPADKRAQENSDASGANRASAEASAASPPGDRRSFLSTAAMCGGLAAGYGAFGVICVRFLFPSGEETSDWQYVATVDQLKIGEAIAYVAPSGAKVVVARQGDGVEADDFIALSSVCPHLGCQVHWEPQNERFFCPCHNGAFDPQGNPTAGPPLSANQSLVRFPLRVENGVLFIEAPLYSVTQPDQAAVQCPGAGRREGTPRGSAEEWA